VTDRDAVTAGSRRGVARALGVLDALAGRGAAVLVAVALADLRAPARAAAVALLAGALALRGAVGWLSERVLAGQQRRLRQGWHDRALDALATSGPERLHALDTAIDHVSEEPTLVATETAAATAMAGVAIVWWAGGWLCAVIVVALVAASVPVYVRVGRASVELMASFHRRRGTLVARQLAVLRSITDLRALGAVEHGADEIAAASRAEHRAVLDGVRVTIRSTLVTEFLGGVSVGLVAMVVGLALWRHSLALTHAMVAVLVTAELFGWLRRYGAEFHRRDDAAAARAVLEVNRATRARDEGEFALAVTGLRTAAPSAPATLRLRRGEHVSLRGPSGIGKSSLIDTALGWREPLEGTASLAARRVGLVRADCHFLDATVRENLTLGAALDDETVLAVLDELGCGPRLRELDAPLGEDARALSSGERVQLAVARAVLAGADLVILDDVGALLDATGRGRLEQLLESRREITVLEASHDLAVLRHPDATITLAAP
jgi:ABC-type transport system involved in cytochrome bd biosynthesis fused ATPase/permease subunit